MKQFDVFQDRQDALFVVLQNDLLEPLDTVVVAPLLSLSAARPIQRLVPIVNVNGQEFLVVVQGSTAIAAAPLRRIAPVASLSDDRDAILDAVNFLYWGM